MLSVPVTLVKNKIIRNGLNGRDYHYAKLKSDSIFSKRKTEYEALGKERWPKTDHITHFTEVPKQYI